MASRKADLLPSYWKASISHHQQIIPPWENCQEILIEKVFWPVADATICCWELCCGGSFKKIPDFLPKTPSCDLASPWRQPKEIIFSSSHVQLSWSLSFISSAFHFPKFNQTPWFLDGPFYTVSVCIYCSFLFFIPVVWIRVEREALVWCSYHHLESESSPSLFSPSNDAAAWKKLLSI